jgi:hypothetical protein
MRAPTPEIRRPGEAFRDFNEIASVAVNVRSVARVDKSAALEFEKILVAAANAKQRVHRKMQNRRRFDVRRAVDKCPEHVNAMRWTLNAAPQSLCRQIPDVSIAQQLNPCPAARFIEHRRRFAKQRLGFETT